VDFGTGLASHWIPFAAAPATLTSAVVQRFLEEIGIPFLERDDPVGIVDSSFRPLAGIGTISE
jgi:hypothetical protein